MNRRNIILGAMAVAGSGVSLVALVGHVANRNKLKNQQDLKRRIASDYQNARTVVVDRWVIADSEAELLDNMAVDALSTGAGS